LRRERSVDHPVNEKGENEKGVNEEGVNEKE
jgi:hypothetical protein